MKKLYLFALFLVIYEFTTYIANDMIMPGMLNVVNEFHAPISYVSLSLSLYILGNSCIQLFLGPLSERFGKRNVILMGNAFFFVMTLLIMWAQNIESFMLTRLLQGSALGFISIGYALIHEEFDDKAAVKIFALMANVSILAPLLGPLAGVGILMYFNWRCIFIVIAILAIVAFMGLFKFTPISPRPKKHLTWSENLKIYQKILCTRQFIFGVLSSGLGTLPLLNWIGLSPTIIMEAQKMTMMDYAIYQVIAIGGLMLSSILMQFMAGRLSFYQLISGSSLLAFIGLALGFMFDTRLDVIVWGIFLYSFGFGIFYNLIMRLIMTASDFPQSMISSLMVFIQTLIFSIGIELATDICDLFHYSLHSFALMNFILGCVLLILISFYACMNKNKKWD